MLDVSVGGGREIDQFLLLVTDQITILVLTEPKGSRLDDQNAAVDEGDAATLIMSSTKAVDLSIFPSPSVSSRTITRLLRSFSLEPSRSII